MRLLILGGTRFFGSYLTELARERGHDVTVMHRGRSATIDLGALDVAQVIGDRAEGHAELAGREFDAVIDTSGYVPAIVADAARTLSPTVGRYVFISSISAYADTAGAGTDEDAALAELPADVAEAATTQLDWPIDMEHYGGLKAASERLVTEAFGEARTTIVRPGLIVGPRDYTDRFNRWAMRMAEDDKVLAPAPADAPVQLIDARDLADFVLGLVERSEPAAGAFNATSESMSFRDFVEGVGTGLHSRAKVTWVDPQFLLDQGVEPWSDLPLWLPESSG
jgi:2'-hydroxyisoflavone reductase